MNATPVAYPSGTAELYREIPGAVARLTGATSWVSAVQDGDMLAAHLPCVKAFYSFASRSVTVNPEVTRRIAGFYQQTDRARRRSVRPDEAAELWQLGLVKTDLQAVIAAIVRGMGPRDEALMESEWASMWQFPHAHTVANGVPEALAGYLVDPIARELGLTERDPRFAEARALQARYVPQVTLIDTLTSWVSQARGTSQAAELTLMARAGSGHLALWMLARRFAGISDIGDPAHLDRMGGWVEIREAVADGLTGIRGDWMLPQDPGAGVEEDAALAGYWASTTERNLRSAARRVAAGPGNAIDLGKFGKAIGDAAEQATQELDGQLDFLQMAWSAAETTDVAVDA